MINPVASHALARAAYKTGVPMWPGAVADQVADRMRRRERAVSGFWVLDYLLLALMLASAVLVVWLRNLNGAVMALSGVGTMLSVLFVVLGARTWPTPRSWSGRSRCRCCTWSRSARRARSPTSRASARPRARTRPSSDQRRLRERTAVAHAAAREATEREPRHRPWLGALLVAGVAVVLGAAMAGLPREHAPLP